MTESRVTAEKLTEWLRRSGALPHGSVSRLEIDLVHDTWVSILHFVRATFSPDAPPLPQSLVVKWRRTPTRPGELSEVDFYQRMAPVLGTPPSIACFAALEPSDDETEIVVLEDLRATHDHPPWPITPSRTQCERALDALARLHATWWESPELGASIGQPHTTESLTTMVRSIAAQLPTFFAALGDALPRETRDVYETVFDSALRPWLRLTDSRALTVVHGDAHAWNFLFPRAGDGPAYLIDWQTWHVDVGARDLAFFMPLHWYPRRRRELEEPLLRYYHKRLCERVDNYSFEELLLDYRRCVVRNLTIPIIFWSRGMKPEGWWHRLECAVAAYIDLNCAELL